MVRRSLLAASAALALVAGAAVAGPGAVRTQEVASGEFDGHLAETAAARAARAAMWDLPSAEDIARHGGQSVRLIVDQARGGLLPMLALEPAAGGKARLVVHTSVSYGGPRVRTTHVFDIPGVTYAELTRDAGTLFTAAQTPDVAPAEDPNHLKSVIVCMDGPTTIMEIAAPGQVQRATEYCDDFGLQDFADRLAQYAIDASPGCAVIQPYYETVLNRLQLCLLTQGDRSSAVTVMNLILHGNLGEVALLPDQAAASIVVEALNGRRVIGARAFRAAWTRLPEQALPRFELLRIRGLTASRVFIDGVVRYGGAGARRPEPSTQEWAPVDGRWRLTRWTLASIDATPAAR